MSKDIEEIPDVLLVPDSLQGREELLEAVKRIRQVLRDEGMSKSQAQTVLAFTQRSLMLGWP